MTTEKQCVWRAGCMTASACKDAGHCLQSKRERQDLVPLSTHPVAGEDEALRWGPFWTKVRADQTLVTIGGNPLLFSKLGQYANHENPTALDEDQERFARVILVEVKP
jgi:hypothetical protein